MTVRRDSFVLVLAIATASTARADKLEFNRDIRPILAENCYLCHGPDKNQRKAKLRLDERTSAIDKLAIVPGKPDDSELVRRILADDETERMPPPATHKVLTETQKQTLKRWVAEGGEYQPHWAYIAPKRPMVPRSDKSAIDRLIGAALAEKKLEHSPEADKRTLLRRLSLDLIGLPPTPEEVAVFVADAAPNAYERQVDRLLASPHYGERMAVPWLDLVRFADTVGYHGDQNQNIFPYRDYVIDSFNRNTPFDRFTREQLAGDLLPNPTTEQRVASAFNRLNMMTREGGAQPKEYLAKYASDRVRTVSITWLGSTMGCCECHDHKFDPFTQRDFYSLAAFFADVKQWGVYQDYDYTPNPDLKGWSNDHPFPPEIEVESPALKRRIENLQKAIIQVAEQTKPTEEQALNWANEPRGGTLLMNANWTAPSIRVDQGNSDRKLTVESGGWALFSGKVVKNDAVKFALSNGTRRIAAIELSLVPRPEHGNAIVRDSSATTSIQLSAAIQSGDGKERRVPIAFADANLKQERYVNGALVQGITGGWRTAAGKRDAEHTAVYIFERPVELADGENLIVTLKCDNIGCVRLRVASRGSLLIDSNGLSKPLAQAITLPKDAPTILRMLLDTGFDPVALAKIRKLQREILDCRGGKAMCLVSEAATPIATRVLPRGNWQDESGPVVQPAVPGFLPQPPAGSARLTRLDLANWLTAPENPLTARVFVNRLWKQLFGVGLSAVMEDVGAQGEWPVHPQLLDWLAVEFRESGWDVKQIVKLMAMSAAYRQSSRARPELREIDPNNRLVAYQSPRRLDAELVRDNALAIAGLLNRDLGGPSVRPYQPAGYYAALQFPDRPYAAHADDRQYRRGLYVHWQRTFLQPMLANFDATPREECTASRTNANTPQQALTLLNDPTFVEAARVLAQRLMVERNDDESRLARLYELALCRAPRPAECESLTNFVGEQRTFFKANAADARKLIAVGYAPISNAEPAELAAWTSVCRVVLNLHETITRY